MTISDPNIFYAILAAKAFVLCLGGIVLLRMWAQSRRVEQYLKHAITAAGTEKPSEDTRQQLLLVIRMEKRLQELDRKLNLLARTEQEPRAPAERQLPIEHAARMARHGASIEDLTRTCGLNIGEAELMQKLHGSAGATPPH